MYKIEFYLLFSYWLLIWYILYVFNIIDYNPTLLLIIVQVLIVVFLYIKFFYFEKITDTHLYIRIILFKFTPLYLLWFANKLYITKKDIYFTLGLFILYNLYLFVKHTHFFEVYTNMSLYRINFND
jgi:hypothetical protein